MKKKDTLLAYQNEVIEIFSRIGGDRRLMREFLKDILTPAEFEDISLRWQVVKRLQKGDKHRDVAGDLGLGISTVSRGAMELRNKKGGFTLVLKKYSR